jgi:hypothetical protein
MLRFGHVISTTRKSRASSHPFFKKHICCRLATKNRLLMETRKAHNHNPRVHKHKTRLGWARELSTIDSRYDPVEGKWSGYIAISCMIHPLNMVFTSHVFPCYILPLQLHKARLFSRRMIRGIPYDKVRRFDRSSEDRSMFYSCHEEALYLLAWSLHWHQNLLLLTSRGQTWLAECLMFKNMSRKMDMSGKMTRKKVERMSKETYQT